MIPAKLEAGLLSSIKTVEDLTLCQREGISHESFVTSDPVGLGDVWDYLVQHARDKGELPTDEDLETLHEFKRTKSGDLKSYIERVREAELGRKGRDLLINSVEPLKANPRETIKEVARGLAELQVGASRRYSYLDRDAMDRLKVFDEAAAEVKGKGIIGIPTGLRTFDSQYLGWGKGMLVVVLGSTGVGKSWLLMYMAAVAYHKANARILVISPELTDDEQALRFDVLLANIREKELSNQGLITGQESRPKYKKWLESLTTRQDIAVIDAASPGQKALSYDDCWQAALEFKPDILMIDGLHLLDSDSKNRQGWEALKDGVRDLKALAQQEKIVVIAAHQAERSAARKGDVFTPPNLSQIAYGFAVGQSADRVISMSWVRGDALARHYSVPKLRAGKTLIKRRTLRWNVDIGCIFEDESAAPEEFEEGGEGNF